MGRRRMNNQLILYSCFILFGTFISAVSQVMLKKATQKTYDSPIKEYLNPLVICAYGIFFLATLCTILAYKVVPLSMGPILEATSYIYVTLFGVMIFKEGIGRRKITALILIITGIIVYTLFG